MRIDPESHVISSGAAKPADCADKRRRTGCLCVVGLCFAFLTSGTACSTLVDTERQQCKTNDDCTNRGAEYARAVCGADLMCTVPTPWSCLGSVVWPAAGSGSVTAKISLMDIVTRAPFPGVTARVCRRLDLACEQPLAVGYTSDDQGRLVVDVPSGFDGFLELVSAKAVPGLYFFNPPMTDAREVPFVPMLPLSQLTAFAQIAGAQMSADRGHMALAAYDCFHAPAEGVSLVSPNADGSSTPFYMINGYPSSKDQATDSSGYAGFLNLPPGSVTVSGRLANGEIMGTLSLLLRAGQMTYTTMLPMPN